MSKRQECLDEAAKIISGDRDQKYGKPEQNLQRIAIMWGAYLGRQIEPHDVAAMMVLLKCARAANGTMRDHWVDMAGYAAVGFEVSSDT